MDSGWSGWSVFRAESYHPDHTYHPEPTDSDVEKRVPLCQLCERDVPRTTVHHLVPKQVGRRRGQKAFELPTTDLCPGCHKQLHTLFPNRELSERLSSIEALRREESVARFLDWMRKQPSERKIRVRK